MLLSLLLGSLIKWDPSPILLHSCCTRTTNMLHVYLHTSCMHMSIIDFPMFYILWNSCFYQSTFLDLDWICSELLLDPWHLIYFTRRQFVASASSTTVSSTHLHQAKCRPWPSRETPRRLTAQTTQSSSLRLASPYWPLSWVFFLQRGSSSMSWWSWWQGDTGSWGSPSATRWLTWLYVTWAVLCLEVCPPQWPVPWDTSAWDVWAVCWRALLSPFLVSLQLFLFLCKREVCMWVVQLGII